jgi:hypothetical protein
MFRRGEVLKSPPKRNKSSGQIKMKREGPNTYFTNSVSPCILNEISDHFPEYKQEEQQSNGKIPFQVKGNSS